MSLRFAVEPFATCWAEVDALARQHWTETEESRHGKYNPDWKRYFAGDEAGWHFMCTARPNDPCSMNHRMVGYGGMWAMPSMHTQKMIANEDTFFLLPAYRKGWNAIRFLKFIESECQRRGVVEINWTDIKGNGALLEHMGYSVVAEQWSKKVEVKGGADSTHAKPAVEAVNVQPEHTAAA